MAKPNITSGETENKEDIKRKTLTFFLLFFPSIIIAIIPSEINGYIWISIGLKFCLLFYQFVTIKNFTDLHYD